MIGKPKYREFARDAASRRFVVVLRASDYLGYQPTGIAVDVLRQEATDLAEIATLCDGVGVVVDASDLIDTKRGQVGRLTADIARGAAAHAIAMVLAGFLEPLSSNVVVSSAYRPVADVTSLDYTKEIVEERMQLGGLVVAVPSVGDDLYEPGLSAVELAAYTVSPLVYLLHGYHSWDSGDIYRRRSEVSDAYVISVASAFSVSSSALVAGLENGIPIRILVGSGIDLSEAVDIDRDSAFFAIVSR